MSKSKIDEKLDELNARLNEVSQRIDNQTKITNGLAAALNAHTQILKGFLEEILERLPPREKDDSSDL